MVETDAGTAVAEAAEADDTAESRGPEPSSRSPDIFISYRLDPDQGTAIALKRLIAGSLDPEPAVFVSGAGGLVPSRIGMRPQLQKAVSGSRAFVAIITPQSKDREWVIFEAGAAWGRGQLYSPVLIDTEPHELGTTIADFVATRAETREQMEHLVRELAKTLGVAMKTHFGTRFSVFERHLEQRKGIEQKSAASDGETGTSRAYSLWHQGKKAEALDAFAEAEAKALNAEERADTKISRLILDHEGERLRDAIAHFDEDLRQTGSWHLWMGVTSGSPHLAVSYYDKVIAMAAALPQDRAFALRARIENLFELGKFEDATRAALEALGSEGRQRRWSIAATLWNHAPELDPEAKLLLAAFSLPGANEDFFRRLSDLAIDHGWIGLGIFAARSYRRKDENPSSLNMLGRAYHSASLMSLAHDVYQEAIVAGTSVARVNLALCFASGPNHGAGLAVLREHKGDFDSLDPAFPHQIRAEAEKKVAEEKKSADDFSKRGFTTMAMLAELLDSTAATSPVEPKERQVDPAGPKSPFSVLTAVPPFAGIVVGRGEGGAIGFFAPGPDASTFRGVTFDLRGETAPRWTTVKVR